MSRSFNKQLKRLDGLIESFEKYRKQFPKGDWDKTIRILDKERAELTNKIGKKNAKSIKN